MSKHTPGPWESSQNKEQDCYDIENDCGILVAEVYDEDDARLIAQSKRLLEALELIVMERAWFREERPDGYNIEERLMAWEETARAAIAAATETNE